MSLKHIKWKFERIIDMNWHYMSAHLLSLLIMMQIVLGGIGASNLTHAAGGDFVFPPVVDLKSGKQEATAAVVDPDGNVIVTGYQNLTGDTNDDYYTVKFKADGSGLAWSAKTFDRSGGSDRATAVVVDSNKDIIVTGITWNGSNKDVQTIKYSGTTGNVIWQATFNGGANADDYATCITVDSLNNVYVGGYTNAAGNDDYFVITYNSNGPTSDGKPIWKVTYNGSANNTDKMTSIFAGTGGIAVTGYSSNGTDFDILTLKYDYLGNKLREWRHSSSGSNADMGQFVRMDTAGNVVVTGYTSNGTDKDMYTAKYSAASGVLMWEKTYAGGVGLDAEPGGLYVDAAGDTYVTGYVATLIEGNNFYTVKYHDPASGTAPDIVWEKTFNSAADNNDMATGIIGDTTGSIYITGLTVASGNYDITTLKYKGDDGTLLWQKEYNGSNGKDDKPVGIGVSSMTGVLASEEIFVAGWSEQAVATDYDYVVIRYEVGALNPPTNLTAGTLTKDGSNKYSVPLTWSDNSGNEDGFILERKLGEFGTYAPVVISTPPDVTTLPANTQTFTDTGLGIGGLDENKYYYYRVKAYNTANGNSHYSNEVRVLTLLVQPITPVWTYLYNGIFDSDDFATGIAVGPDNHPVVTGYSLDYAPGYVSGSTSTDYLTVKLNKDTKAVIWSDQHEGGFNQEDDATGIVVDSANNVIVTGNSFQYPGSGDNINSIYTLKYNGSAPATILWKGQYNGPGKLDDRATAIASAVDGSNNIAVVGHGKKTATNHDIYLMKYASTGSGNVSPVWSATPYDGGGNDYPSAVAFDSDGNIFITGYTETGVGTGIYNSFTAKYCGTTGATSCAGKTQGQIIWSHAYAGNGDNRAKSLAVDNDGNVYVAGYGVNPGTGKDFLVIKYDGKATPTSQRVIWAQTANGSASGDDEAVSVKVDPIDNNVVVGGTTLTTACSGAPSFCDNDFRIIRYTPEGTVVWDKTYLRAANDDHMNAIALDISGNIFAVGHTSNGLSADSMSVKFSYDGTLIGTTVFNGTANDFDEATAVAVNSLGDAFVAGYSRNASTGGNGANDDYLVYKVAGVQLQAPSPFTATPNYTSAILAWADNSSVEAGFHLERKIGVCDSSNPWLPLAASPLAANTTGYTDTGLTIGQTYCYRVRAFASSGEVTRWIERSASMQTPPAPGSLTATVQDTTTINLAWTDTTTNESGFQIERCEGSGCDFSTLDSGFPKFAAANAVSYSDTSACSGKSYRYRILSYKTNTAGTGNEWESAFTTIAAPVSTAAPTTPTGLSAVAANEAQITLSWSDTNSDETGFNIYECTVSDCSSTSLVGTTGPNVTTYNHYGLLPNSSHKYQVRAYKTAGCGWESNPVGPASATTAIVAPTLTATATNTTQIDLSWTDTTGSETGFELQKCTSGDCTLDAHFTTVLASGQNTTSYTDTTICHSTTNKYRVRAINEGLSLHGGGSWTKRAALTITNFQPQFQTKMTLAYQAGMKADFSDIRFYDETTKMELPYWIESKTDGVSAVVWLKTGPANNVYLYFGNASATSASNGSGTFEFFDDFSGSALASKWSRSTAGAATIVVSGGILTLDATANADKTSTLALWKAMTPPYRIESRVNVSSSYLGSGLIRIRGLASGYVSDAGLFDVGSSIIQPYFGGNTWISIPTNQYVRWKADHVGASGNTWSVFNESGTQLYSTTYTGTPSEIRFSVGDLGGGNGKMLIDWVLARKLTATDPTVSVAAGSNYSPTFTNTWTGPFSALATATTPTPSAPTIPAAVRISESEIKVTWKDNTSDETGFYIDRCTVNDCSSVEQTLTVGPNIQLLNDTGLTINTTYYYRIRAYKTATCSGGWDLPAASIVNAATTLLSPTITPTATPAVTTTCDDIRFTDSDGSTLLNYYIESGCNTNNTKLHVKVPSIANGTKQVYLYYGNPLAQASSDGTNTWDFFDDFNGSSIDTSKWTITDGTGFSVSGGYLHGTNTTGRLTSKLTLAAGQNVQAKAKTTTIPTNGVTTLGAYTNGYSVIGWLNHPGVFYYRLDSNWTSNPTTPPTGSTQNDWMIYSLVFKDASTVNPQIYDVDLSTTYWNPGDLASSPSGKYIILGKRLDDGNTGQGYATDWDWVRIRKYANPAPYFSLLGSEELGSFSLAGSTWNIRRPLTITHTGSTVTNYQVTTYVDTTSLASDQVSISWTDNTANETRFVLERCTGAGCSPGSFTTMDTFYTTANTTSYTDRTVVYGTKYCYRVSAEKQTAASWITTPSDVVCATTSSLPAKPTLTITPHETTMDLAWNDTASGESGFVIQRCKGVGCDINSPDQTFTSGPNQATYSDTTVCSDTYTYRVKAVKYGSNAWESSFSDPVSSSTVSPTPPTLVSATRISDSQIDLVWQDNTGDETGFEIDRCEGSGCDFSVKTTLTSGGNTTSYSDKGLKPGILYRYRVRAYKTGGTCGWPSSYSTDIREATTSLTAPTGLSGTAPNTTQANLVWTDTTSNESGFAILRCKDFGCTPSVDISAAIGTNTTSFSDTGVCSNSLYNYQIKATNTLVLSNGGGGCWSSRAPLTIANFQPNFLTKVVITYDSDMKADYSDLRFLDTVAKVELPYWIEASSAGSASVWFMTGSNNSIMLYYGNPSATSNSSQTAIFGTGLMASWPFNEASGTISGTTADVSGQGNNVTLNNIASGYGIITSGPFGNTLSLDGSNDFANKAAVSLPTGNVLSIEAWIYPKNTVFDFNGIVSWGARACTGGGMALSVGSSGKPQLATWCNDFVSSGASVTMNAWNHLAVTLNGKNVSMYLNGVKTTGTLANTPNVASTNLSIGTLEWASTSRMFNGMIDEVRVYNRVLSDTEIAARYAAAIPSVTVGTEVKPGGGCASYQFDGPLSTSATVVTPAIGNLVVDPDFENGVTNWSGTVNTTTGTSADSTTYFSGKTSFKLAATGAASSLGRKQTVAVIPGESYVLSGYIKTALTAGKAQCDVTGAGGVDTAGIAKTGTSDWSYLQDAPVVIPAGTTTVDIRCFADPNSGNPNGSAWFDMVQLVPVPAMKLTGTRVSEAQINLAWNDIISDETGYRVERCSVATCNEGDYLQVSSDLPAGTTSFSDTVPVNDVTYTYRVKAFKNTSCGWTTTSNTVAVNASVQPPSGLIATPINTTRIDLAWANNSATESGFIIERCSGQTCTDFAPLAAMAGPGATSFSDTTVCNGQTYRYQVKAFKNGLSQGGGSCWTRRKDLTVANHQPAFPLRYTVTYDSDMKADFSDLRFYDAGSNIELPYWVESKTDSSTAVVWIKTGASTNIQMYYGNANATSVSSGSRVFDFFDDFTGTTINSSKWQETDNATNYITQNNEIVVNANSWTWTTGMYSKQNFARPFIFEINAMVTGPYNTVFGIKDAGTGINVSDYVYGNYLYWYNDADIQIVEDGSNRGSTGQGLTNSTWKYFRMEVLPTGAKYYFGNSITSYGKYYDSSYSSESPLKIGFSNDGRSMKYDNARVRRYASVEPTISATGSEVVLGSCPVFSGQWTSGASNIAVGPGSNSWVTTPAWSKPTGLTVTAVSDTQFNLLWTDNTSDETGFKIERCTGSGCTPADLASPLSVGANITSYSDPTTSASQIFCYRVRATKAATCGWDSDYSDVACDLAFAQKTSDLTATPLHSRAVHLSWTDNATDEEGYDVEIQTWNGTWAPIVKLYGSHVTNYDHTQGLEPGKQYKYRVRPFRGTDTSPYSNEASVTLPSFVDSPPTCP